MDFMEIKTLNEILDFQEVSAKAAEKCSEAMQDKKG